jgi:hypothetical protein
MSPFVIREYCHGTGETFEPFHSPSELTGGCQVAPPTLAHIEKIRLLKRNCPAGNGPDARIHFTYHAVHHAPIVAGTDLITSGYVSAKYVKRDRTYLDIEIEVREKETGRLLTSYSDSAILGYRQKDN